MGDFKFPYFFDYPPYFTLQPVQDTREKQMQLWKELILRYCQHHKCFIINLEQEFPLFQNLSIQRKLSFEAREMFLAALVAEGKAEWLDKAHKKCLVLWRSIQEWSEMILQLVRDNAMEDGVLTLDEIQSGDESRGTELAGIDRFVLVRALKLLEQRGKAAMFKGKAGDDEGVKFSAS
ncbi:hypothetical protein SELMODRAFT_439061 [Selaginella moellendorffii]|uniref:ESCRT-II complex subunit VPS25 n=1 Tax=Selaginella moellendorffii TaxID=88036 RepID=D8R251_SELML|nr:vacuolar protein sorting-associated protein 25 [Selaginella moellendorffii]EFJ33663.1 hypothetical protein SELMODRAFT_439061 [Selaginella moellendorffii]|eukprot:XP_002964825.1 vacuolar protein sorting-associated protein 25 [Selaginella moellendorffii]